VVIVSSAPALRPMRPRFLAIALHESQRIGYAKHHPYGPPVPCPPPVPGPGWRAFARSDAPPHAVGGRQEIPHCIRRPPVRVVFPVE
jgi:hypothetical protein